MKKIGIIFLCGILSSCTQNEQLYTKQDSLNNNIATVQLEENTNLTSLHDNIRLKNKINRVNDVILDELPSKKDLYYKNKKQDVKVDRSNNKVSEPKKELNDNSYSKKNDHINNSHTVEKVENTTTLKKTENSKDNTDIKPTANEVQQEDYNIITETTYYYEEQSLEPQSVSYNTNDDHDKLFPYSVRINNKVYPINNPEFGNEQNTIDLMNLEWINWSYQNNQYAKIIGEPSNLYLAAHNYPFGQEIWSVNSVEFCDYFGNTGRYVKYYESEVFNPDYPETFMNEEHQQMMNGMWGDALIFQTCIDEAANATYTVFVLE